MELSNSSKNPSTTETLYTAKPLLHESLQSLGNHKDAQKPLQSTSDLAQVKMNDHDIQEMLEDVQRKCIKVLDKFLETYSMDALPKIPISADPNVESFPTELALLIEKINLYLKSSDKPSLMEQRRSFMSTKKRQTPNVKVQLLSEIMASIDKLDSFLLDDVFDKIANLKGKLENQTFQMSPEKQKVMEFTKTLDIISKAQAFEMSNQSANFNTLANVVDKIPMNENVAFEKQKYHPSKAFEEKIEIAKLSKILDRIENSKMQDQVK